MGQETPSAPPYEVERSVRHVERPGFRMTELQIGPTQEIPWHHHTQVRDTLYVLAGRVCVQTRAPESSVGLGPGETMTVEVAQPHRVTNAGADSAVFLLLQGMGAYDFVRLP